MASFSRVLYVGVTNDLARRVSEHKRGIGSDFTRRYGVHALVYYEACSDPRQAIEREKELKGWRRSKKIDLVESMNPAWNDLSEQLFS